MGYIRVKSKVVGKPFNAQLSPPPNNKYGHKLRDGINHHDPLIRPSLVGGFNPPEKYSSNLIISQFSGWKLKKYLSCHHPDDPLTRGLLKGSTFRGFFFFPHGKPVGPGSGGLRLPETESPPFRIRRSEEIPPQFVDAEGTRWVVFSRYVFSRYVAV